MRLNWDEKPFETGLDRGVLYVDGTATAWPGLVSVTEKPSGSEGESYFIDGVKHLVSVSKDDFMANLEAIHYPDEFEDDSTFDLSYRTQFGSGHKIHLVHNARSTPSEKTRKYGELTTLSWDISTLPIEIQDYRPSSHLIIDTNEAPPVAVEILENMLYGTPETEPIFPSFEDLLGCFTDNAILTIIVEDDGSWTAIGPDDAIHVYEDETFEITWPSVVYISEDTYTISTW